MKWAILIASVEPRTRQLCELLDVLAPQLRLGEVEVLCCRDGFQSDVGTKRNSLLDSATADYVSFIDDDDMVVADFVDTIFPLLDGVDTVSFDLSLTGSNHPGDFVVTHRLHEPMQWRHDGRTVDIGHLCPMRREIAARGRFSAGYGDDAAWGAMVRQTRAVQTEHHIDRVLYEYRVSAGELWDRPSGHVQVSPHPAYPIVTYVEV